MRLKGTLASTTVVLMVFATNVGLTPVAHAAPPGIQIADVTVTEGNAGTVSAVFNLVYGGAPTAGVTVDYTTNDGTATTADSDYASESGTLAMSSTGCKCGTITVTVNGDTTMENDETFTVDLSNPVNKTLTDAQGIGTITNDDFPNASVDDPTVAEDGGTMTFTVTLDASAPFDSQIGYATNAVTATDGADYTGQTGTLTILSGDTSGTVDVPVLDDSIYEGDETLTLDLTVVSDVALADNQGTGTITEDDPEPAITVDDPTVSENGGTLTFTITLDTASGLDTSVDFATSDNTSTDGDDYTGQSGTATILAGSTTATVDVPILDDSIYEGDETLNLDLSGEVNGTLSVTQGHGTINEDDPKPVISVDSPSVGEVAGTLTFTISLDTASGLDTSVGYATSDLNASDGSDYTGTTGTATILAGDTSTTVDVTVVDDAVYEGDETLSLDLSNPVNGTGSPSGTGTITDDETAPSVTIDSPSALESAGTLTFTITTDTLVSVDVSVNYATSGVTATANSDYTTSNGTATVTALTTSTTVDVPLLDDAVNEPNETFIVTLSGATLGTSGGPGTGTILNDDKQPSALTIKATRTRATVKAAGLLEPAQAGNQVTVKLQKRSNGRWVKVASKVVTVRKLADRDADTKTDARYSASFARPHKHGRMRFTVRFAGDTNTAGTSVKKAFRV